MKYYSVSVIIPTYNNGRFIKFALESLLHQNYPEELVEIIVIDDGSTDNTNEIINEYRERVIYIYQEKRGIATARNKGMSITKGEIITFLDADDMWYKKRLEMVIGKFNERKDVGIVYHPFEVIDSNGLTMHKNFYKLFGYKEGLSGWLTNAIFSGRIFCGGSSFAFRKSVIDKVRPVPDDIKRGVDYYITVMSSCYVPAGYIPDVLGKYRFHGSNITMSAGHSDYNELAVVNKDFADMRQKVIEKISNLDNDNIRTIDLSILKRIQAKEIIFYNVLSGKRLYGIKRIPLLFKGNISVKDLLKGIVISFIALFVPAYLYPKSVKAYGILKRLKIVRF
jgi:glycosyltransferase involved in cell wall biosynthesis